MTEKELRKLNRYQLLELLILQTERADRLQEELKQTKAQLEAQEIKISNLGSIAEASLQLSGIFEAAQKAADLYLKEARKRAQEPTADPEKSDEPPAVHPVSVEKQDERLK